MFKFQASPSTFIDYHHNKNMIYSTLHLPFEAGDPALTSSAIVETNINGLGIKSTAFVGPKLPIKIK